MGYEKVEAIASFFTDYARDMRGESPKRVKRTATKTRVTKAKKRAVRKAQKKARKGSR